jgi:hypothetical protein
MIGYKRKLKELLKQFLLIVFSILFILPDSKCQEKKFYYDVMHKGSSIGHIILLQKIKDNLKYYALKSEVKTWYIFSYQSQSIENAVFENGIMMYSFFYEKQNGKEIRNETIATGNYFKLISDGNTDSQIFFPVHFNTVQLYTTCPGKSVKVYATHYQKFLDFIKVSESRYRLELPNGNFNYFNYNNGICTSVDVERSFFTIHFILKKIEE